MTSAPRYTDYDRFAWIYNQHWGGFSQMVLPLLDQMILGDLPAGARVLDVACGTGHVSRLLVERGYQVTGIDGSAEMLAYARENAPGAEFIAADARDFSLPAQYAAALSTFDSLNHILVLDELEQAFARIFAALLPGGRFAFDLNLEEGYVTGWNGHWGDSFEDHAYVWKNSYDPEERLARFDATLFRLEDGCWQRSDVTLWQRSYPPADVLAALQRVGFTGLQAWQVSERIHLVPLQPDARRGFFAARKP
ncbi:MAG TPA: methyltransferase domain-containing protein [Anaerolineaceae bacterium]